ncbi:hypothetical protein L1887_26514 [Cichorium endivia]|nr:hypothetical protein L1887_26514 [Cichorium endivia]
MAIAALVEIKRKRVAIKSGLDTHEPLPISFLWIAFQYLDLQTCSRWPDYSNFSSLKHRRISPFLCSGSPFLPFQHHPRALPSEFCILKIRLRLFGAVRRLAGNSSMFRLESLSVTITCN